MIPITVVNDIITSLSIIMSHLVEVYITAYYNNNHSDTNL